MSFPLSHKTVIVLDHGSDFLASCQQMIDLDQITKTRTLIPLAPISKTLWSCSVESSVEYCRIVWDIYPTGRLIRFVVADGEDTRFLNTWSEQSVSEVMLNFGKISTPSTPKNKMDVVRAVEMALGTLCEPSEIQHERRTNLDEQTEVINKGRVIVITQLQGETETIKLEKKIKTTFDIVNKVACQDDKQIPLQEVEIVLIHTSPGTKEISVAPTKRKYGDLLTIETHTVTSGQFLSDKLCQLVQIHYQLAITTVTGIPMKEEQNANSSANYDVELLHPVAAHADFIKGDNSQEKREITLKWCTPRTAPTQELQYCTAAFRITPVDINSRPSSCLTNFLLTGRAVMLELPRKSGSKLLSHMLASHGGEIYIHTLGTGRSALEDPPSISEGTGGRVTDYRITDFGQFMKDHSLVHFKTDKQTQSDSPLEMTMAAIERATLYWPLVISRTSVYNVQSHLEPLLSIIVKPVITADQVIECKKVIFNLVNLETKGTALSLSSSSAGQRGKGGPRKEEQYRALWTELEQLVRLYCSSTEHQQVLECLMECKKTESSTNADPPKSIKHEAKSLLSESPPPIEDAKPKKLRVAPELLGKTSLLGLIKDNQSRKPATNMWLGFNPDTRKTQLYQNVKDKAIKEEPTPMDVQ